MYAGLGPAYPDNTDIRHSCARLAEVTPACAAMMQVRYRPVVSQEARVQASMSRTLDSSHPIQYDRYAW